MIIYTPALPGDPFVRLRTCIHVTLATGTLLNGLVITSSKLAHSLSVQSFQQIFWDLKVDVFLSFFPCYLVSCSSFGSKNDEDFTFKTITSLAKNCFLFFSNGDAYDKVKVNLIAMELKSLPTEEDLPSIKFTVLEF